MHLYNSSIVTPTGRLLALVLLSFASVIPAYGLDLQQDNVKAFVELMVDKHQMKAKDVKALLADAEIKESILEAMRRPAEKSKAWHEYRKIFVTPKRTKSGVEFWQQHATDIERIADDRGVPAEIIVAIIGVETNFGKQSGGYRVIDALSTLAFAYPPRSPFFTGELEQFLLLVQEENIDPLKAKGSYAGAMGSPQFIPSSYRTYSADGDKDGQRDLFGSWKDIFASVANYFIEHGWQTGEPVVARATTPGEIADIAQLLELKKLLPVYRTGYLRGHGLDFAQQIDDDALAMVVNLEAENEIETWIGYKNYYVITRYNRSKMYAMAVTQLADAIKYQVEQSELTGSGT